jgi:hypothetical protein
MLTLEKFRLVIINGLLTAVSRPRLVIGNSLCMLVRWRGGGEVAAFRRQNQVYQVKDTWPMGLLYLKASARFLGR